MPITFDVTFRHDQDTRLRMEYVARDGCFRVVSLAFGKPAAALWQAMRQVAATEFEVSTEEEFLQLLEAERFVVSSGADYDRTSVPLQEIIGRYLSIMHGGRHPLTVRSGDSLRLFWSGPGMTGLIHEDTINTIEEIRRTPPR